MSTRSQIFRLLVEHKGEPVSGEAIGTALGISRAAVWKGIRALREEGYPIEAITNKGYTLTGSLDYLSAEEIDRLLEPSAKTYEIKVYDSVESTNKTAKELALSDPDHGVAVVANQQTAGRGRLGRSFYSPEGAGLYMSLLFRPTFDMSHAILITTAASVAVVRAIEALCPVELSIKWVNDIYLKDKKICGILTEALTNFETAGIDFIILGIGVNCFEADFPKEISPVAGNLGGGFSRNQLAAEILNQWTRMLPEIEDRLFLEDYRKRSGLLGKEILVFPPGIQGEGGVPAQAIDIDRDGGLVIRYLDGPKLGLTETLSGGEVSVRKVV